MHVRLGLLLKQEWFHLELLQQQETHVSSEDRSN